jgi:hypothetical protein
MSPTHRSTHGSLIRVSIIAIHQWGDSNPGTPVLATTNSKKLFMKALALSCSPFNTLGRFPICFKSAATGIGTRCWGGITSPLASGPGGLPLPPPLGFPPGGPPPLEPVLHRAAAKAALSHSLASTGAAAEVVDADVAGMVVVAVAVGADREVSPGARVVARAVVVVPISIFDGVVQRVKGELCCPVGVTSGAHGSLSVRCGLPGLLGSIIAGAWCVSGCGIPSSLSSSGDSSLVTLGKLDCPTSPLVLPRYGCLVRLSC